MGSGLLGRCVSLIVTFFLMHDGRMMYFGRLSSGVSDIFLLF